MTRARSTAPIGTPAAANEASANVGQQVTLEGAGFVDGVTKVTLEAMVSTGLPSITTVEPNSVAADGRSLVFTVPNEARAGIASILGGGSGRVLQIVPTLTSVSTATPGSRSTLVGSGFIEGFVTVRFGAAQVVDGGPFTNDGVDVFFSGGENRGLAATVPNGGGPPVSVTTEGGTSNAVSP